METFNKENSLEKRLEMSNKILKKYNDRIPVYLSRCKKCLLDDVDNHKYICPNILTLGQFMFTIKKKLKLKPEEALYLLINEKNILPSNIEMINIYKDYKDDDGFLYISYCSENTFGI